MATPAATRRPLAAARPTLQQRKMFVGKGPHLFLTVDSRILSVEYLCWKNALSVADNLDIPLHTARCPPSYPLLKIQIRIPIPSLEELAYISMFFNSSPNPHFKLGCDCALLRAHYTVPCTVTCCVFTVFYMFSSPNKYFEIEKQQ